MNTYFEVDGVVMQVKLEIEGLPTIVDIAYSGNTENGKEILEFEYATISVDNKFNSQKESEFNKMLENGLEERIVHFLVDHYKETSINFSPNEYQF